MSRKKTAATPLPVPTAEPSADTPSTPQTTTATFSNLMPSTRSARNTCPRCMAGLVLGAGEDAACLACGYRPASVNEYASAEAYLATLRRDKDGDVILPRETGIPGAMGWS